MVCAPSARGVGVGDLWVEAGLLLNCKIQLPNALNYLICILAAIILAFSVIMLSVNDVCSVLLLWNHAKSSQSSSGELLPFLTLTIQQKGIGFSFRKLHKMLSIILFKKHTHCSSRQSFCHIKYLEAPINESWLGHFWILNKMLDRLHFLQLWHTDPLVSFWSSTRFFLWIFAWSWRMINLLYFFISLFSENIYSSGDFLSLARSTGRK